MPIYTVTFEDPETSSRSQVEVAAEDPNDAAKLAERMARRWVQGSAITAVSEKKPFVTYAAKEGGRGS